MNIGLRVVGAVAALILLPALSGTGARADTKGARPTIGVDRVKVHPGDEVLVVFNDWRSLNATLSVCGNLARRGSPDCDQIDSAGVSLAVGAPRMISDFTVNLPPVPCPCVIEALSIDHSEASFAPIDIVGAPVAAVAAPVVRPPVLGIVVRPAPHGLIETLRSALGGPTPYDVTISVRNPSTDAMPDLTLTASTGRTATNQTQSIDLPAPGPIASGGVWSHVSRVVLSAPVIGHFAWEVLASGSGPPVHAEARTKCRPWGLIVLAAMFGADVAVILARRIAAHAKKDSAVASYPPRLTMVPQLSDTAA